MYIISYTYILLSIAAMTTTDVAYGDKHHGNTVLPISHTYNNAENHHNVYMPNTKKAQKDAQKQKTLAHIEAVLDVLNDSTGKIITGERETQKDVNTISEQVHMKRFAKPTHQIKGLVNMINNVADDLNL